MAFLTLVGAFASWLLLVCGDGFASVWAFYMLMWIFCLCMLQYRVKQSLYVYKQFLRDHRNWRIECTKPNCLCRRYDDPTLAPGTRVMMSRSLKRALVANGSEAHIREFGDCVGTVMGQIDYGDGQLGPELDVRWSPSNLRYAYHPDHLLVVP